MARIELQAALAVLHVAKARHVPAAHSAQQKASPQALPRLRQEHRALTAGTIDSGAHAHTAARHLLQRGGGGQPAGLI